MKINKYLSVVISEYINNGSIIVVRGGKHNKIKSSLTGDWLPLPCTPGDRRAAKIFRSQVRRLANEGAGVIAYKKRLIH